MLRAQVGALSGIAERARAQVARELPAVEIVGRRAQLLRQRAAVLQRADERLLWARPGALLRAAPLVTIVRGHCLGPPPVHRLAPPGGGGHVRVLPALDHQLHELVEQVTELGVAVAEFHTRGQRGLRGRAHAQGEGLIVVPRNCGPRTIHPRAGQVHDRQRAAYGRAAAHARVHSRSPHDADGRAHQRRVRASGRGGHDRLLLRRRLVVHHQVLEPVAQRLREVTGGHVLRRILGRDHLEPVRRAYLPEVRHLHDSLVQRRQQQVLRRLRQPVQLVEKEDAALAHGEHQGTGDERVLPVAQPEHQGRVEPAGQPALREPVVAVDADGLPAETAAGLGGQRRLARADRALEQKMHTAVQHRARGGHLLLPSDHAADGNTLGLAAPRGAAARSASGAQTSNANTNPGPCSASGTSGLPGTSACASPWYSRGATSLGPSA